MITLTKFSCITVGFIIIPTETKKTAPKKSFIGLVRVSIFSSFIVSAKIDPMINAPNAEESSTSVAKTTIPKHKPKEMISSVSSLSHFFAFLRKVGIRKIPHTTHTTIKKISFPKLSNISVPSKWRLTAIVPINTMTRMAKRSSNISMPKTTSVKRLPLYFGSSNPFTIIVVDDKQSIQPSIRLFHVPHPSHSPIK